MTSRITMMKMTMKMREELNKIRTSRNRLVSSTLWMSIISSTKKATSNYSTSRMSSLLDATLKENTIRRSSKRCVNTTLSRSRSKLETQRQKTNRFALLMCLTKCLMTKLDLRVLAWSMSSSMIRMTLKRESCRVSNRIILLQALGTTSISMLSRDNRKLKKIKKKRRVRPTPSTCSMLWRLTISKMWATKRLKLLKSSASWGT